MAAQTQRSRAAQIELYPLLGQQGPLDSLIEGSDGRRLKKLQRRVPGGKPGSADQAGPNEEADLELGPEANWEPMKLVWNAGRDMRVLRYPQDDPRRCIQDGLETVELEPAGTVEDAVTVVDPVTDEAVREHENRFLRERVRIARKRRSWKKQERHSL